jgi:hypothetical protein
LFPTNAKMEKATLRLRRYGVLGTPFAQDKLSSLSFERVHFGDKIVGGDFDSAPSLCANGQPCTAKLYGPPSASTGDLDVTAYFLADWTERFYYGQRSHFRVRFANNKPQTGPDNQKQQVFYTREDVKLIVEYLIP